MDIFSFPLPFTNNDSTKKLDLRARAYQGMVKFYGKVSQEVFKQSTDVDPDKINTAIETFRTDAQRVFDKFKAGESYDELNAFEKWNEDMGKMMHRGFGQLSNSIPSNGCDVAQRSTEMTDIGNELETFWDEFFQLRGGLDQAHLTVLLDDFQAEVKTILGLGVTGS